MNAMSSTHTIKVSFMTIMTKLEIYQRVKWYETKKLF